MDFNKFDSVSAAEKGANYHVRHPATLKPLFDNPDDPTVDNGKPCLVELLGAEGPTVRALNRKIQKAQAQAEPKDEHDRKEGGDELSIDDIHDRMVKTLAPRVLGFTNIKNGNTAATKKDAVWFFNLNHLNSQKGEMSFVEQAGEFSGKRSSCLGNVLAD